MHQPQRQQDVATLAHRFAAIRPVALCALLLLSLLASLWQPGTHGPRQGNVQSSSATGEERGETALEEQNPAKLRRSGSMPATRASQPLPHLQSPRFGSAALPAPLLIPATLHQAPPSLHSPRQQRGQAPPLA